VAGELEQNTGVGEAARVLRAACGVIGVARGAVCLSVGAKPEGWAPADAALLLAVNAPSIPLMLARADKAMLRGRRVMGAWAWELPVVPRNRDIGARYVHEVWACSPFAAAALERLMPGKVRAVKFSGAAPYPKEASEIAAAAAGNVKVFSGNWAQARVEALLACADIVLSLHRSEGFGLVPAQAMLRGIPVVATGWSGNIAFVDEQSAALVGYRLVKVADSSGVYEKMKGVEWAEPDIGHAAELLRRLGDDAAWRAALGARGKAFAEQALNGDELRAGLTANGIDGA
jgi:glycosyltransferase involved in cell wall biosynthesis